MSNVKSELTKAIKAIGISPQEFAPKYLGLEYQAFRYRVRKGKLSLENYHTILHYTGKTFDELWPSPYTVKRQPIAMNLSSIAATSKPLQPADVPVRLTPQKEIKDSALEAGGPAPSPFKVADVYESGVPPIE